MTTGYFFLNILLFSTKVKFSGISKPMLLEHWLLLFTKERFNKINKGNVL